MTTSSTNGTGNSGSSTGIDNPITTRQSDRQNISITDVISEGPIYGLVSGISSVFLNDDSISDKAYSPEQLNKGPMTITLANGSTSATINNSADPDPIIIPSDAPATAKKYLVIRSAFPSTLVTSEYQSRHKTVLNTSSSYFTNDMLTESRDRFDPESAVPARLTAIKGSSTTPQGVPIEGFLHHIDSTTTARWRTGSQGDYNDNPIPDNGYLLDLDRIVTLASVSGTSIVLDSPWAGPSGAYKFDSAGIIDTGSVSVIDAGFQQKYQGSSVQFRSGTLHQTPFSGSGGEGSTGKATSLGLTMEQTTGFGTGSQAPRELLGSGNVGLSASQLLEVDEVKLNFVYPGGFYAVNGKGKDRTTYQQYQIAIALKEENVWGPTFVIRETLQHSGLQKNATTFEHSIDLTQFRPFQDFRLTVSRKTAHDGPGYDSTTTTFHDWGNITNGSLSLIVSIMKEKLAYPLTAMAKTTFSTKEFQNTPKRGYHVRGLLINVPSNYITREESGGAASYKRNISTGAVESTYQDWDGSFREELVYTNNPAWVFYDLLTNNRYGLGDFIQDMDIDIYSLYRIARYCDEEVDNGKGGVEPRYTLNAYFTKAADAYKVLKDVSTTFLGMLYFLDGKIHSVQDAPSSPVYSFSKANVIDGAFTYEGTGSKTRANQVVVSWNNPDNNYKSEPLLVEDKINIAETGVIINQAAVAFGCTSEGQALRYGRWKLWTASNQREVVSFSTGLNGGFIGPGDVVNIQDADRTAVRYSGRISNTGTLSSTVIPLDAPVNLNGSNTYTMSVIVVEPGAFLSSDSATIDSVDYTKGDLIKQAYIDHDGNGSYTLQDIATEEYAANAKAAPADTEALLLSWKDNVRVETQEVVVVAGSTSSITVSTAFSNVPALEDIWVLTEQSGGVNVEGSAKEYKVLAISQSSKNTYDISAVEHYDSKYDAVEKDFTTYVAQTLEAPVKSTDIVPVPLDVFYEATLSDTGKGNSVAVSWRAPQGISKTVTNEDGTTSTISLTDEYEFLHGFEIEHDFPGVETPLIAEKGVRQRTFSEVATGTYNLSVRTLNTLENKSQPIRITINVENKFEDNLDRLPRGLPYGGLASTNSSIDNATGLFELGDNVYGFKAPQSGAAVIENISSTLTTYQQDCSGMAAISWTQQANSGEFIHEHHYLALDSSDAVDRIKLLKYYKSPSHQVPYWFDAGNGSNTTGMISLTGTVTKASNSSRVEGSGTLFTSELAAGELFVVGTSASIVARIESDTVIFLDRSLENTYTASASSTNNLRFDFSNDTIIGRAYQDSSNVFHVQTFLGLDATLAPQKALTRTIYRLNSNSINTSAGSFGSPLAGNTGWGLSVPSLSVDGDIVYVSTRTFTNNGATPQDAAWSTPTVYAQKTDGATGAAGATGATGAAGAAGAPGSAGDSVVPIYATDASGNGQSFTQQTREYINYYEYNTTPPTLPVSNLTWVKFSGDGVVAIFASDASGNGQSFTQGSLSYVNYHEYSGAKPSLPVSNLTWVKYVGADGGTVNFAFKRSTGTPGAPTDTTEPVGYPSNGWYDDAAQATGAGVLYAIKGTLSGTTWTWGTAYALDGAVAQELYIYNLNVQSPTTNGSYQFADTSSAAVWTTPTGGWSKSPPSLASDGDIVYVSAAVVTGNPGSTVAPSWSTGVVHSRREDGAPGAPGAAGVDAFNVVLGWTSRVVPRDASNNPDLSSTANTVTLYKGGTLYGSYSLPAANVVGSNITPDTTGSGGGTGVLNYGTAANMTADEATITYGVIPVVGGVNQATIYVTSTLTLAPIGGIGNTGFLFVTTLPAPAAYDVGQVVIVEASAGAAQQGYIKVGAVWVARDIVNHEIIFANAIRSDQLEISRTSAQAGASADRVFINDNAIQIFAGGTLRVKLGNLNAAP
tara:strand:- start:39 stop:5717 length:5679 start_codon:yes stop_codon:yes gene_type:complete